MNRLRYRIVFNECRGMCMAVAETARSCGKGVALGAGGPADGTTPAALRLPALRRLPFLLGLGLGGLCLAAPVFAQVIADPNAPGSQRATVLNTANGVIQVNVQTPSATGVSRNVYSRFDVPTSGVVLNNSRTAVQSQIGGWVQGNPWMTQGTARVILNEVNASDPSRLQGHVEVAGSRAEVVIANPAGIVVNGGGFINVSRAVLTTGTPRLEDGRLTGYSVARGQIAIEGAGLDASSTDYTALIARAVQVNAGVWAQRLDVVAGVNDIVPSEGAPAVRAAQGAQGSDGVPQFAIDVARLGGMYANHIYLVGTEAGVGVRNAGEIGAAAGELVVTAAGRIENAGTLSAAQSLRADAGAIDNRGTMQTPAVLALHADQLRNSGRLASGTEVLLSAKDELDNSGGAIEAPRIELTSATLRNAGGSVAQTSGATFSVDATRIVNDGGTLGRLHAAAVPGGTGTTAQPADGTPTGGTTGAAPAEAADSVAGDTATGTAATGSSAPTSVPAPGFIKTGLADNTDGTIVANAPVTVRAGAFENRGGQAYLDSLAVSGLAFDNTAGALRIARGFSVHTDSFVNDGGKLLVGIGFDAGAGRFSNRQGLVQANQIAVQVTDALDNAGGTLRQLGSMDTVVDVGGVLGMNAGTLDVAGSLRLRAVGITGGGSSVNAGGDLTVVSGAASAARGRWMSGGAVNLQTDDFDNRGGAISATGSLTLRSGALDNAGGTIAAGLDATIAATGNVKNDGGLIQAERNLALTASGAVNNQAGTIETLSAHSRLDLQAGQVLNDGGHIANAGDDVTAVRADSVDNGAGHIGGNGALLIAARTLSSSSGGSITAPGTIDMRVSDTLVNAGSIRTGEAFHIAQSGARLENHGSIVARDTVAIDTASVDNSQGMIATATGGGGTVVLNAGALTNRSGAIQADGAATLNVTGAVDNAGGWIQANRDLSLDAGGRIDNREGNIETLAALRLQGGDIANKGGSIVAGGSGATSIKAATTIDNDGRIGANGALTIEAAALNNGAAGNIGTEGNLYLAVRDTLANHGAIGSAGTLTVLAAGARLANSGTITAGSGATLAFDSIDGSRGTIATLYGSDLQLQANTLINRDGRLSADGDVRLSVAGNVDNTGGTIQAAGSLDAAAAGAFVNRSGVVEALGAHGTLALRTGSLDNTAGRILSVGDGGASIEAASHVDNTGRIAANGVLALTAATLKNAGTVSAGEHLDLAVADTLENTGTISAAKALHGALDAAAVRNGGSIVAGAGLSLAAGSLDNTDGSILSAGSDGASISAASRIENTGRIAAGGALDLSAATLHNAGTVSAGGRIDLAVADALNNTGTISAEEALHGALGEAAVRNGGTIIAGAGLSLTARSLDNINGSILSAGGDSASISAASHIENTGRIAANGTLDLSAATLDNAGNVSAGEHLNLAVAENLENTGTISAAKALHGALDAAAVRNGGSIVAGAGLSLAAGSLDNLDGSILSAGDGSTSISAASHIGNTGRIAVDGALDLSAATLHNAGAVSAGGRIDLAVADALNNTGTISAAEALQGVFNTAAVRNGGTIIAGAGLSLTVGSLDNIDGSILSAGGDGASISAASHIENRGRIAANGTLDVRAAVLENAGTVSAGGRIDLAVAQALNNTGTISAAKELHGAFDEAAVRNGGTIVAGRGLSLTAGSLDNAGGTLATASGSNADLLLNAGSIGNKGGNIMADRDATILVGEGIDNNAGRVQARGAIRLNAGGLLDTSSGTIETLSAASALQVHAASIRNEAGRILNAGTGDTTLQVGDTLANNGRIAANGALALEARTATNGSGGSIDAGGPLALRSHERLENAGSIASRNALTIDEAGASIVNRGSMVADGEVAMRAGAIDNDGGTLATATGSGASLRVETASLSNRGGRIVAERTLSVEAGSALDNSGGRLQGVDAVTVNTSGTLGNDGGTIEASGLDATLTVQADSVRNGIGRIVNAGTGAASVTAATSLENRGLVAGNGRLDVRTVTLDNGAGGTLAANGAMMLTVGTRLDNAGAVNGGATLDIAASGAAVRNAGIVVARDALTLSADAFVNDGGQLATAKGRGAGLRINAGSISNRAGAILADRDADVTSGAGIDNAGGTLQTGGSLRVDAAGGVGNDSGAIEALDPNATLALHAASLDNGSGRVVNVGSGTTVLTIDGALSTRGLVAGNGSLALSAASLDNGAGGTVAAATTLGVTAHAGVTNAGTISSGADLAIDVAQSATRNNGRIVAGASATIDTGAFDNRGGQLVTATNGGGDIALHAASVANAGGAIVADGSVRMTAIGAVDNTQGTLHANGALNLDAGGNLGNRNGVIEVAGTGATLDIQAAAVDNTSGHLANAGSGATRITADGDVYNSGILAGNGSVDLSAATVLNGSGTLAAGSTLDVRAGQAFGNAGTISAGAALNAGGTGASIANRGQIAAGGHMLLQGAAITNDGGQIATQSGAEIVLDSASILSNRGGNIAAGSDVTLRAAGTLDNSQGQVQTPGRLMVSAGGALVNDGGALEAVGAGSTLDLRAGAIDNRAGRIVNAGSGTTVVASVSGIVNSGTVAGNGDLNVSALTLQNQAGGAIGAGDALELVVSEDLDNGGIVSAGSTLHLDQAGANVANSGRIGAGGTVDIRAASIANNGGQLYTVDGSGASILLRSWNLTNAGTVAADGLLHATVGGGLANDSGRLYGGYGTCLDVGGVLTNAGGAIEAASSALDIAAQSLASSGRIVNAGGGASRFWIADAFVNGGTVAVNGALDLHAATLQNGGQLYAAGPLLLDVRQAMSNTGTVGSGGTLRFDQAGASFTNAGQIAAGGNLDLTAAAFNNDGGRIATVRGSGANIRLTAPALSNRGGAIVADGDATFTFVYGADNAQGALQAGGNLALTTGGNVANWGGVIEAVGAGSTLTIDGAGIDNGDGRIVNTGGDTRLSSANGIANAGTIASAGRLALSGQTLYNGAGGTVASGGDMNLVITRQLTNQGKINSGGTLTSSQAGATFVNNGQMLAGGNAVIVAKTVSNDGGQLGTGEGSGADLSLTSEQLSNQGGRITAGRDLAVTTRFMTAAGELSSGRDLALAMEGDYVNGSGTGQLRSNRDLSLSVTGNITNTSTFGAVGTLRLAGQNITNVGGATIAGNGIVLQAAGNLNNAGEIDGRSGIEIVAANVANTGAIAAGNVAVATGNLDNTGAAAIIGATSNLALEVDGTLNNTSGATLYSGGDLAIGGRTGATDTVNNLGSTIEAGGNLALMATTLNNVRENVRIERVQTVDETVHMNQPSWHNNGDNPTYYDTRAANYAPFEVYFFNPSDIIEDKPYVTPDGYTIRRAVVRTHANDSAFNVASTSLHNAYGSQDRIYLSEGTRVLYYFSGDVAENPDQGGPASNAIINVPYVTSWVSQVGFSNQYGNCKTDCIRMISQPDYDDPRTTVIRTQLRSLESKREKLEVSREAHHTAVEDRVAPGAGAVAQILSGGNMRLTIGNAINNEYGMIKAGGVLDIRANPAVNNVGATLYRVHNFDGTFLTEDGSIGSYQQESISEVIGTAAGVIKGRQGVSIVGRSFRNVDVTAGTVGNVRDSVNVIGSGTSGTNATGVNVFAGGHDAGGAAQVSAAGSAPGNHAGLAGTAVVRTGGGGHGAVALAAASGVANGLHAGGAVTASGYANDAAAGDPEAGDPAASAQVVAALVVAAPAAGAPAAGAPAVGTPTMASGLENGTVTAGAVEGSGIANGGRLSGPLSAVANATRLGGVRTVGGAAAGRRADIVKADASGAVMQVTARGLFIRNPDPGGSYVYETRPQFADRRQWISSDYLLDQVALDPAVTHKRLGDGFYEQRMVREQLSALTGQTVDIGAGDDSMYKSLLANAVSAAQAFGLRPGVALSAEQVARLTSDIVWMESQTVMLPDGSVDTVLVPKVYVAHVGKQGLKPGGALVTGDGVRIDVSESIANEGGVIDGGNGRTLLLAGQDIVNAGGTIKGGAVALAADGDILNKSLAMKQTYDFGLNGGSYTSLSNEATIAATGALDIMAGRDLSDLAGKINAGSANLSAGRNIDFGTLQTGSTYRSQIAGVTEKDSTVSHQLSRISTAGDLRMAAGGNLSLSGTQVAIGTGGKGDGQLLAGGKIDIAAVTDEVKTSRMNDPRSKDYDKQVHDNQTIVGATVNAAGSLAIGAGIGAKEGVPADLNIKGSYVRADDAIALTASGNVNIEAVQESHLSDTASTRSSSSVFKSKTTQAADYVASSQAVGAGVSGKSVDISAGKDVNVVGSNIAGDDVRLAAKGSVHIAAATNTLTEQHHTKVTESGFLGGGGGFGISYGTRTTTTDQQRDATLQSGQARSMVGSLGGNLEIVAGDAIKVGGSDLTAGLDMNLIGRSVTIDTGRDRSSGRFEQKTVQDALTLAVSGSVVNAVQTTQNMDRAVSRTKDTRMHALAAAGAAMAVNDAVEDVAKNGLNVRLSLTVGHSEQQTTQTTASLQNSGSALTAGRDLTIRASGGGQESNVAVVGSTLKAQGNIALKADNQVNLLAAQDTEVQHSDTKSMSAAVGIGVSVGTKERAAGLTASASLSRGNEDGNGTTQVNAHVSAGKDLLIDSGGDTTIRGAVASGTRVVAEVGGDLNVESLQDTATFDGKRQSVSGSGTIGGGAGVSANISASKVHSDYASVTEQSGIRAGDGGFQVQVTGNTDLKGGVISSSEQAIRDGFNSLETASLSYSDIKNHNRMEGSGISPGSNVGKNQNGATFSPSLAPGVGMVNDHQDSVTRSGISGSTLTVDRHQAGPALANLNRNVSTGKDTAQALSRGRSGAEALADVGAQMEITSTAMPRLAREIGDYAGKKVDELTKQGNLEEAAKWAEGGIYRVAAHTALGAMGGGMGGAVGAAAVAEAAPTIEKFQDALQDKLTEAGLSNTSANLAAKLLASGVAAGVGNVAGSAGTVAGLNAEANNRQLHPNETKWIKNNAKRFAQQQGISEQEAERRLAQQGQRQVQFGVEGSTDAPAMAFLRQAHGLLVADPTCPTCGPGYMFYATPEQKTNAHMYSGTLGQTAGFYQANGLKQPTLQQIVNGATTDRAQRDVIKQRTVQAAVAAGSLAMAPAFAGVAAEVTAFAKNPVGYCIGNPAGCMVAAEAAAYTAAGVPQATSLVPVAVGSKAAAVAASEVAGARAGATIAGKAAGAKSVVVSQSSGIPKGLTAVDEFATGTRSLFAGSSGEKAVGASATLVPNKAVEQTVAATVVGGTQRNPLVGNELYSVDGLSAAGIAYDLKTSGAKTGVAVTAEGAITKDLVTLNRSDTLAKSSAVVAKVPEAITPYGTTISEEIALLRNIVKNNNGVIPGLGERGLTRVEYDALISQFRGIGPTLQNSLDAAISSQPYVYRATTLDAVEIYRKNGHIAGRSGGTYMSTEYVGTDVAVIMDRGQVFQQWGVPNVLLRIPTSEISSAIVPRPLGNKLSIGWEPSTLFYPKAGSGGQNQFLGTTKTWDDSWVIPLPTKKGQ